MTSTNGRRVVATIVAGLLAYSVTAFSAEPVVRWSAARPSDSALLVGEPVLVVVSGTWVNPEPGRTLVSTFGSLSVSVERSDGTLAQLAGCGEIESRTGSDEAMPTITWSQEKPTWSHEIDLSLKHDVFRPDTYRVVVAWSGTEADVASMRAWIDRYSNQRSSDAWRLFERQVGHPDAALVPFVGVPFTQDLKVSVACPTGSADRAVYQLVAGGECPAPPMSVRSLFRSDQIWPTLVERHPTSRYVGYVFAKGLLMPPYRHGVSTKDDDAGALVAEISSGEFIRRHPTVRMTDGIEPVELDTRAAAREHRDLIGEFLRVNPGFQLRDKLELAVAYDELLLGDASAASEHWEWVVANSNDPGRRESAGKKLVALASLSSTEAR